MYSKPAPKPHPKSSMEEPLKGPISSCTTKPHSFLRRLIDLDTRWSLNIHTICQPFPRSVLKALEISGDGRFWFPIPVAIYFSPRASKRLDFTSVLFGLFVGSLLDLLLIGFLKYLIRRPRPVYNKGMHLTVSVDHWSFPSGHSSRVFFIASFLYLSYASLEEAFARFGDRFVFRLIDSELKIVEIFVVLVFLWSAATSMSRVLLGRHFVFDVIAGACLGVFEALFVFYFLKIYALN